MKKVLILVLGMGILFSSGVNTYAESKIGMDEMENVIYEGLVNRENKIAFKYEGSKEEIVTGLSDTIKKAYNKDSYTARAWSNINPSLSINSGEIEVNINVSYLTSKEQEQYVDREADKIIESIPGNLTVKEKVRMVNDYLVDRFEYDKSLKSNNAYSALKENKAICQGYSMTAYKVLNKMNIPCEIAVGSVNGTSHSWNKVFIAEDGKWLNLDITNNDSTHSYRYFLVDDSVLSINGFVW